MKAVLYLRVSGDGQISGDGFPRQRIACEKFANSREIDVISEFLDEGVTGKMELEGRSGLSACLQFVREHSIEAVIVEDATRLARDMIVAEVLIREFQKLGVKVLSASGGIDLTEGDDSNPTAKLIRQILAAVSEFERCCIVLKLRGARERKKAKEGRCEGKKEFGFYEGEKLTMRVIRGFINATPADIASYLNVNKLPTRSGKPWRASTVRNILARQPQL